MAELQAEVHDWRMVGEAARAVAVADRLIGLAREADDGRALAEAVLARASVWDAAQDLDGPPLLREALDHPHNRAPDALRARLLADLAELVGMPSIDGLPRDEVMARQALAELQGLAGEPDIDVHDRVLEVLLYGGANPNVVTKNGVMTEGFMRDARTKGETPLHRAAAFGCEDTIELLLKHGAKVDVRDAIGDSPLSWASWYLRPDPILRLLCFDKFRVRPDRKSMRANLVGFPSVS